MGTYNEVVQVVVAGYTVTYAEVPLVIYVASSAGVEIPLGDWAVLTELDHGHVPVVLRLGDDGGPDHAFHITGEQLVVADEPRVLVCENPALQGPDKQG